MSCCKRENVLLFHGCVTVLYGMWVTRRSLSSDRLWTQGVSESWPQVGSRPGEGAPLGRLGEQKPVSQLMETAHDCGHPLLQGRQDSRALEGSAEKKAQNREVRDSRLQREEIPAME